MPSMKKKETYYRSEGLQKVDWNTLLHKGARGQQVSDLGKAKHLIEEAKMDKAVGKAKKVQIKVGLIKDDLVFKVKYDGKDYKKPITLVEGFRKILIEQKLPTDNPEVTGDKEDDDEEESEENETQGVQATGELSTAKKPRVSAAWWQETRGNFPDLGLTAALGAFENTMTILSNGESKALLQNAVVQMSEVQKCAELVRTKCKEPTDIGVMQGFLEAVGGEKTTIILRTKDYLKRLGQANTGIEVKYKDTSEGVQQAVNLLVQPLKEGNLQDALRQHGRATRALRDARKEIAGGFSSFVHSHVTSSKVTEADLAVDRGVVNKLRSIIDKADEELEVIEFQLEQLEEDQREKDMDVPVEREGNPKWVTVFKDYQNGTTFCLKSIDRAKELLSSAQKAIQTLKEQQVPDTFLIEAGSGYEGIVKCRQDCLKMSEALNGSQGFLVAKRKLAEVSSDDIGKYFLPFANRSLYANLQTERFLSRACRVMEEGLQLCLKLAPNNQAVTTLLSKVQKGPGG